jgi:hypothetical protein
MFFEEMFFYSAIMFLHRRNGLYSFRFNDSFNGKGYIATGAFDFTVMYF